MKSQKLFKNDAYLTPIRLLWLCHIKCLGNICNVSIARVYPSQHIHVHPDGYPIPWNMHSIRTGLTSESRRSKCFNRDHRCRSISCLALGQGEEMSRGMNCIYSHVILLSSSGIELIVCVCVCARERASRNRIIINSETMERSQNIRI